jgi:hypothetical protein
MGERTEEALRVHFDARVRLEFHGVTLTSDAGLLACRELDDTLGLTQAATRHLEERRSGRNVQYPLVSLLRQFVYSRLEARSGRTGAHLGTDGLIWEIPDYNLTRAAALPV